VQTSGGRDAGDTAIWEKKMQVEARSERMDAVAAHPLAELLECPPSARSLLQNAAQTVDLDTGQCVFRQGEPCRGLYVLVTGHFVRRANRFSSRVVLGPARAGELVELAAALGGGSHTYTLVAQTPGTLLMLPIEELRRVFQKYPPLQMRLLEELAREVSRAYITCSLNPPPRRHRNPGELPVARSN
jgi:CRP-like cAMP-binding protein